MRFSLITVQSYDFFLRYASIYRFFFDFRRFFYIEGERSMIFRKWSMFTSGESQPFQDGLGGYNDGRWQMAVFYATPKSWKQKF